MKIEIRLKDWSTKAHINTKINEVNSLLSLEVTMNRLKRFKELDKLRNKI